ncbi:MAG: NAD-dependent epimerase/dehydratase family protein [Candidatus Dormibacteraeota bacterium]|nr:NAD-dependent epimerase/dehydratase family protein [Candidatus Dormibacteraeota bacterium]
MRVLVLGGTVFVGRAVVEAARRQGAEVTIFTRGRTAPDLFGDLDRRRGDRDRGDYASLASGRWDAVVDVSGYTSRHVREAMAALGDRVGRYVFVSSHAVYERGAGPGADESAPLRPALREGTDALGPDDLTNETYGPCKVACEEDVAARFGACSAIVRLGKVAGPHDAQDGFTYWVRTAARGGRIAVPGTPEQPVQVVDVRDAAALIMRVVRDRRSGPVQAVGPFPPTTLGGLITTCAEVAGADVELVPVPLERAGPMFPLVRPPERWDSQQRSAARAHAWGMPATPLAVTAADVLAWDRGRGLPPLTYPTLPAG